MQKEITMNKTICLMPYTTEDTPVIFPDKNGGKFHIKKLSVQRLFWNDKDSNFRRPYELSSI